VCVSTRCRLEPKTNKGDTTSSSIAYAAVDTIIIPDQLVLKSIWNQQTCSARNTEKWKQPGVRSTAWSHGGWITDLRPGGGGRGGWFGGGGVDVAEGQAVGEPAGVGGGRGVGLGRWRCGGVEVGEVEQALHRRAEPRRRTGFSWGCSPPTDGWAGRKRKRAGGSVVGTCLTRWSRGGGMLRRSSRKQSSAMAARPHASASDDPSPLPRWPSLLRRRPRPGDACCWLLLDGAAPRREGIWMGGLQSTPSARTTNRYI